MLEAPQYFSTARGLSIRQDIGRIGRGLGSSSRRKGTSANAGGGLNRSPIASGCMVVADGVADPTVRVIDRHLLRSRAAGRVPIPAKTRRRQRGTRPGRKDHQDQVRAADFQHRVAAINDPTMNGAFRCTWRGELALGDVRLGAVGGGIGDSPWRPHQSA